MILVCDFGPISSGKNKDYVSAALFPKTFLEEEKSLCASEEKKPVNVNRKNSDCEKCQ